MEAVECDSGPDGKEDPKKPGGQKSTNPPRDTARKQAKISADKFVPTKSCKVPLEKPFAWQKSIVQRLKLTVLMISRICSHHALRDPIISYRNLHITLTVDRRRRSRRIENYHNWSIWESFPPTEDSEKLYRSGFSARYSAFEPSSAMSVEDWQIPNLNPTHVQQGRRSCSLSQPTIRSRPSEYGLQAKAGFLRVGEISVVAITSMFSERDGPLPEALTMPNYAWNFCSRY